MGRTNTEERNWEKMHAELVAAEQWQEDFIRTKGIPAAWCAIEREVPCRPRLTRIHLGVDPDVAKFYRAMGEGYQARMNAVLRLYMLARLARHIPGQHDRRGALY